MIERRASGNTTRQCARFGCSAVAIATFTFDSATCTVWLDTPMEGNARAGELCARHARSLTPPRGWKLEDRRGSQPVSAAAAVPAPAPRPAISAVEAREPAMAASAGEPREHLDLRDPEPVPARQLAAGPAGRLLEDELRGLLDAHSPLLARAFRSSGTV